MRQQPTVAVDFDGVLHAYSQGWHDGSLYDQPMLGAKEAVHRLSIRYRLVVFTARHNLDDVRAWLRLHRMEHYFEDVTNRKPAAVAYVDDRALRFVDWAQTLEDLDAP